MAIEHNLYSKINNNININNNHPVYMLVVVLHSNLVLLYSTEEHGNQRNTYSRIILG